MKKFTRTILLLTLNTLILSCSPSENEWHNAAAKLKVQSVYVKDNNVSTQKDGKISNNKSQSK